MAADGDEAWAEFDAALDAEVEDYKRALLAAMKDRHGPGGKKPARDKAAANGHAGGRLGGLLG